MLIDHYYYIYFTLICKLMILKFNQLECLLGLSNRCDRIFFTSKYTYKTAFWVSYKGHFGHVSIRQTSAVLTSLFFTKIKIVMYISLISLSKTVHNDPLHGDHLIGISLVVGQISTYLEV